MTLENLLREITPIYNKYHKDLSSGEPKESITLMWEIGFVLEKYIQTNKVPPHALYREIYGKSEGLKNIKQRSYISREFLGRSYRIKKIFSIKEDIQKDLLGLKSLSHFREAMPFFDNPKFKLNAKEKAKLLSVINGNLSNKEKEIYIKNLQKENIGIKNPRTQQLNKLKNEKAIFIKFYNDVYEVFKISDYIKARRLFSFPQDDFIKVLSRNCGAISADGLKLETFELPKDLDPTWQPFSVLVKNLIKDANPKERRRFRRLIPPARMVKLSEMLYALTSADKYKNFKL